MWKLSQKGDEKDASVALSPSDAHGDLTVQPIWTALARHAWRIAQKAKQGRHGRGANLMMSMSMVVERGQCLRTSSQHVPFFLHNCVATLNMYKHFCVSAINKKSRE